MRTAAHIHRYKSLYSSLTKCKAKKMLYKKKSARRKKCFWQRFRNEMNIVCFATIIEILDCLLYQYNLFWTYCVQLEMWWRTKNGIKPKKGFKAHHIWSYTLLYTHICSYLQHTHVTYHMMGNILKVVAIFMFRIFNFLPMSFLCICRCISMIDFLQACKMFYGNYRSLLT